MIASFKVDANDRVRVKAQIDRQNFETDIIVVHLVIAERDVNVNGMHVLVFDQKLFVNFGCFFEVRTQVMERGHAKLIFNCVFEATVQVHDFVFISKFLGQLE